MPINTVQEARDEILAHFTTAWNAGAGATIPLIYSDREADLPADGSFARVTLQHSNFNHATLGGRLSGGQRFRRNGIVTVQVFTPSDDGLGLSDTLGDLALSIFEGQATGSDRVEFRNTSLNEIGHDGAWHQTNVLADFNYDLLTITDTVAAVLPDVDPDFASTVLLARFDGADGSTTFSDQSFANNGAFTFRGLTQLDDAQTKFGATSLLVPGGFLDSGTHVDLPDNDVFHVTAGQEFAFDAWVRPSADGNRRGIMSHWREDNSQRSWELVRESDDLLSFNWSVDGTSLTEQGLTSAAIVPIDLFTHVAVTRDAVGMIRLFVGGNLQASQLYAGAFHNSSTLPRVGTTRVGASTYNTFNGHIDDARWTIGTSRWSVSFTPPTVQVPIMGP